MLARLRRVVTQAMLDSTLHNLDKLCVLVGRWRCAQRPDRITNVLDTVVYFPIVYRVGWWLCSRWRRVDDDGIRDNRVPANELDVEQLCGDGGGSGSGWQQLRGLQSSGQITANLRANARDDDDDNVENDGNDGRPTITASPAVVAVLCTARIYYEKV